MRGYTENKDGVARRLRAGLDEDADTFEVFNECQDHVLAAEALAGEWNEVPRDELRDNAGGLRKHRHRPLGALEEPARLVVLHRPERRALGEQGQPIQPP